MQRPTVAVGHRALSAATALVFGGGLALYQMTSLVVGPPGARQLHLSLSIPMLDRSDRADPVASGATIVLGSLAPTVGVRVPAGRPATPVHRIAAAPAAVSAPSPVATQAVTVSPVPTSTPRPLDHPRPPVEPPHKPPRHHEGD